MAGIAPQQHTLKWRTRYRIDASSNSIHNNTNSVYNADLYKLALFWGFSPKARMSTICAPINYSKYPDTEVRLPRSSYTAKLKVMCTKLEGSEKKTIAYKHWLFGNEETSTVEAVALWVVGSYARGAATCGDLDLVFQVQTTKGMVPNDAVLKKLFLGILPRVRMYRGTPDNNGSGAKFQEAILVWQPGMDWKSAIAGIAEDLTIQRYARPINQLPLRGEQLRTSYSEVDLLLESRDNGTLTWTFTPLSEITPVFESGQPDEHKFLTKAAGRNKELAKTAPLILGYSRMLREKHGALGKLELPWDRSPRMGGTVFLPNNQWVSTSELDDISCVRVVCTPALNTRGPNGFWTIERGPNHPLVKAFESAEVWAPVQANGPVSTIQYHYGAKPYPDDETVKGFIAFRCEDDAQDELEFLNAPYDDTGELPPEDELYAARCFKGREILELLAETRCDVLDTQGEFLPLTPEGLKYPDCSESLSGNKVLTPAALGAYFVNGFELTELCETA